MQIQVRTLEIDVFKYSPKTKYNLRTIERIQGNQVRVVSL